MNILCEQCDSKVVTYDNWIEHICGRQHQQKLTTEILKWDQKRNEKSIVVKNLRKSPLDAAHHFSQYGLVADLCTLPDKDKLIIQFDSISGVEQCFKFEPNTDLKLSLIRKATLKKFQLTELLTGKKQKKKSTPYDDRHLEMLRDFDNLGKNIDLQFQIFCERATMSKVQQKYRENIIAELKWVLRDKFPYLFAHVFGSFLTNLGDNDSDIDIYIDPFGLDSLDKIDDQNKHNEYLQNDYRVGQDKMAIFSQIMKILKYAKNNTNTISKIYSRIIGITEARIPIIKCFHLKTNISFDLSFENLLSYQNSKMILFYLEYDARVKPLMIFIRYWAKFHMLIGSNTIKSYAMNLLVLVFLMKLTILPSLHLLQSLEKLEFNSPLLIDGWHASFCEDIQRVREKHDSSKAPPLEISTQNNLPSTRSILKLAHEFFETFAQFDFKTLMVCTLLGDYIPKDKFISGKESDLPPELDRYAIFATDESNPRKIKATTPFVLQDPLQLDFNVGSCAGEKILSRFQEACKSSLKHLNEVLNKEKNLMKIFVKIPKNLKPKPRKMRKRELENGNKTEEASQPTKSTKTSSSPVSEGNDNDGLSHKDNEQSTGEVVDVDTDTDTDDTIIENSEK